MSASLTLLPAIALSLQPQAGAAGAGTVQPVARALSSLDSDDQGSQPATAPGPQEGESPPPPPLDNESIDGRRRPGYVEPLPEAISQDNPGAVRAPPPEAFPTDQLPIPDRWRLISAFCPVKDAFALVRDTCHSKLDPYHQNVLKGDIPIDWDKLGWLPLHPKGHDWFFSLNAISDTVFEPRTFPIPVGIQTTTRPNSLDVFGDSASYIFSQTFIVGAALTKGSTAFMPPVVEYRVAVAFNMNYANVPERRILFVEPSAPSHRFDSFVGLQEAFIDYHIRNVSERYDFDSIRVGIQPFQSDFRGFLFNDNQLGIRLFGNRDNNRFQYNLAAFWRLDKDTNSGLNNIMKIPRDDILLIANLYRQDFLIPALTSQITFAWNINLEGDEYKEDTNGFPITPPLIGNLRGHHYDAFYLGYNADGRIGRINLTASLYGLVGQDRNNMLTGQPADIRAFFAAGELSYDRDWMRFRLSGAWASGDKDPFDNQENGFDAVFENPVFAGADTSYWIRQSIPFAGGGRQIFLNNRNGMLNALRSSKDEGQSNFNNPGLVLVGVGADFDLSPEFRLSTNANHLWFQNTSVLEALRIQGDIDNDIGWDLSAAAIWRPKANQNIIGRLSAATLVAGDGFKDLFGATDGRKAYFSVLANLALAY